MTKQNLAAVAPLSQETLNDLIVDAIQDIKGKNIIKLDLQHLDEAPCDFFIICEGDSTTQVKAISGNISKRVRETTGQSPLHTEGMRESTWILVDYFETVVHIFHPDTRRFFDLEDLWSDGKFTEYQNL